MATINRNPIYSMASGNKFPPEMRERSFGPSNGRNIGMDFDFNDVPYDVDGFEDISDDDDSTSTVRHGIDGRKRMERTGDDFNKTKLVPFMIATDGNTATQVAMLLEMIRYCMENSKNVIDSSTGESKTYDIHLRVRNRGNSNFVVSIGDESMPPLPVSEEPFLIGN